MWDIYCIPLDNVLHFLEGDITATCNMLDQNFCPLVNSVAALQSASVSEPLNTSP